MSERPFDAAHRESADALGAYALGALPEDEAARVQEHLRGCERCREDLAALRLVVDSLPSTVPPVSAPPELRERLMSVVRSEAELLQAAGSEADRPPTRRRRLTDLLPRPGLAGAAAGAAVALGVAGFAIGGGFSGGAAGTRTVRAQVSAPGAASTTRVALRLQGTRGTLVVHDLPSPPARRVYQLWVQRGSEPPVPAGATFSMRSGAIEIPHSMAGVDRVMVSAEPVGGSPAPTRPPVVVARAS